MPVWMSRHKHSGTGSVRSRLGLILFTVFIHACGSSKGTKPKHFDTIDRFPLPPGQTFYERKPVLDEATFRLLIHRTIDPYQELAALHQAKISLRIPVEADVSEECKQVTDEDSILRCSWESGFANADAGRSRQDMNWYIGIGGGLARLPSMTAEGLTLVLCHEIGHLFGGYPFIREGFTGLALPLSVDGQADYFAAQVCLRKIWAQDDNAKDKDGLLYQNMIESSAQDLCDEVHAFKGERELCYKTVFASLSFVKSLRALDDEGPIPSVDTPDGNQVGNTDNMHPAAQCRLDTFLAGALCPTVFLASQNAQVVFYDESSIPGYNMAAPGSEAARNQSIAASCHENLWPIGARPLCWFNPEQTADGGWMDDL